MVERLVANEKVEGSSPLLLHNMFKIKKCLSYQKKCIACDGSIPAFDKSEIHKYSKKVDGWDVKSNNDKSFYLIKNFKFKILGKSKFVNKVSVIAEEGTSSRYLFWLGLLRCKIFTPPSKDLQKVTLS